MDQDESKEAGSGQKFMTQVFKERQNNVALAWPLELECQGSNPASATYKLWDFRLHT